MNINVQIVSHLIGDLPKYSTSGSAAVDLRAAIDTTVCIYPGQQVVIPTGLKMAIPSSMVGLLLPRSGLGVKGLVLGNGTGVIDSDYRGEIKVCLFNRNSEGKELMVNPADRICQMMFVPVVQANLNLVELLDETKRGEGGFGSTGI